MEEVEYSKVYFCVLTLKLEKMFAAIYLLYVWKENESTGKIGIENSWNKQ